MANRIVEYYVIKGGKRMNRYKLFGGRKKTLICSYCNSEIVVSGHTYERLCHLGGEDNIVCSFCKKGKMSIIKKRKEASK